jgi:hypothetical protein
MRGRKGGVRYELESRPKGMRLSPSGRLTWDVPADFAEGEATVILTLRDASGREVFHSFIIRCR